MATRPAEIAEQTGTDAEFLNWVRAEYPQCLVLDEQGQETGELQDAYTQETGIQYFQNAVLEYATYDAQNNELTPPVLGGRALLIDWYVDPEREEQNDRLTARIALNAAARALPPGAPDRITLELGIGVVNRFGMAAGPPGVAFPLLDTMGWAGGLVLPDPASSIAKLIQRAVPEDRGALAAALAILNRPTQKERWRISGDIEAERLP